MGDRGTGMIMHMTTRLTLSLMALVLTLPSSSVASIGLTNYASAIDGIYFSLTDGSQEPTGVKGPGVPADKPLEFLLRNTGTNTVYFIFLPTRGFHLKLLDPAGVEVPKTAAGKALSREPKSLTDLNANFSLVGRGHPGTTLVPERGQSMRLSYCIDALKKV
jgi:hypothetical protein